MVGGSFTFDPAPPTSPDRRPSGEHLKDPPPSSLDCPSRWCRSLFHPAKRKDVCRVERPFARILNGAPCASPSSSSPLPSRRWRIGSRPHRMCEGHGGTLSVWLACDCRSPQYPPHPSATATTVFVTGFSAAFRPSFQTSFSGLWRDTAGGSCVGDPVLPRSPPCFIQLFLLRLKRLHALRLDAAILRFRCAVPTMVGSAPACCCNTCVVVLSSCFEV